MEALLEFIRQDTGGWALGVIFLAAALEYMVPPFPADTVVLAGALLVIAGAHSFWVVLLVAVVGGMLGAWSHYLLGRWWFSSPREGRLSKIMARIASPEAMERFFEAFRKRGLWLIIFNRALVGVRAVTFLGAGAAQLPLGPTMLAGLVSHIAWTLAILGLGVSVGDNWEKIQEVFSVYKTVVYAVGGVAVAAYLGYRWFSRKKRE